MPDDAGVERGEEVGGGLMLDTIFPEPPRPPSPEPTTAVYERSVTDADAATTGTRPSWSTITVQLVGSHPLWGHYLWNAARALARYLERTPSLYRGLSVLELGAGAGLPALLVAKNGARNVVITDYPDRALVDNLAHNVARNVVSDDDDVAVVVLGYVWGRPVEPLLEPLSGRVEDDAGAGADADADADASRAKFDLILLSDLIFNHSQHRTLLWTCEHALAPRGSVLVFFTHHRPHLAERDMAFFEVARETGWACDEVLTERFAPMFPEDPGEEGVRSTVHGWKLTRAGGGYV